MKNLNLYLILIALIAFSSCGDDETVTRSLECDKLTSREEAEDLMNETSSNKFADSAKIIENLIGEWGLIGMVPGWVGFETGQECLRLKIDANTIELVDLNTGANSSTDWKLTPFEVNGYTGFYLETNEEVWNNRIGMDIFSEEIMYGSGRVEDGNIFIYEKLD